MTLPRERYILVLGKLLDGKWIQSVTSWGSIQGESNHWWKTIQIDCPLEWSTSCFWSVGHRIGVCPVYILNTHLFWWYRGSCYIIFIILDRHHHRKIIIYIKYYTIQSLTWLLLLQSLQDSNISRLIFRFLSTYHLTKTTVVRTKVNATTVLSRNIILLLSINWHHDSDFDCLFLYSNRASRVLIL